MIFGTIRLILFSIAFIICFFLIRKSNVIYKSRWYLISFVIAVILATVSVLIPVENAFVTFSSPQSAFSYINKGEIKLVINGKHTDFVVGEKKDTDFYSIIPKTDSGWKLSTGLDTKRIFQRISAGIVINVYKYRNFEEYYITVLDTNGSISDIFDNHNSEFYHLYKENGALNKNFYTYYACVQNMDSQYVLTVNGKNFSAIDN